MPKLLMFVEKTHPILRETMPKVSNFDDPELLDIIENMRYSIQPKQLKAAGSENDGAAGMAANQWGIKKRVFIFTPDGSEPEKMLEVVINPSYMPYLQPGEKSPKMTAAFEGCFSIPLTTGCINRYEAIVATYFDIKGKKIERVMKGWEARVFQHETDHLNGKLYDGVLDNFAGPECQERIEFANKDEMDNFWVHNVRPSRK